MAVILAFPVHTHLLLKIIEAAKHLHVGITIADIEPKSTKEVTYTTLVWPKLYSKTQINQTLKIYDQQGSHVSKMLD